MKKILTLALIAGMALAFIGAVPAVDANSSPQILTGVLNKMETAHKQMKSLKAELIQQKINPQIGSSDTDYGMLIYKPAAGKDKGKLRIDYIKPGIKVLSVIGENFTFYEPNLKQAMKSTVGKVSKGKTGANLVGLDGSLKSLLNNYNIDLLADAMVNGQLASVLRLTPKSNGQYKTIDLWINQQSWLPIQWKMTERNGDYTVVTLKNTQVNTNIADSAFVVNLPNGTKIIDKF